MTSWDAVASLPMRRIVGLMSGTSVDGIDAALVEVRGFGASLRLERVVECLTVPFQSEEQARIHALFEGNAADICEMNVVLGEWFAEAALAVIRKAGMTPSDVHVIGSHGQTIYHIPRGGTRAASSLQIGEPSVIAERTGITTVGNFRLRDIAAGGEGAPLVPYVDWALCHQPDRTIALQNIGGIANVTVVTPELDDVLAFDTGPGNMVIDAGVALVTDRRMTFDEDGRLASLAQPNEKVVEELLGDPYFARVPPKSTGREYWGVPYVRRLWESYAGASFVSDLTEFVARSIRDAYERFVFPCYAVSSLYLSGGGQKNPILRRRLEELFAPLPMLSCDALGLPVKFKEAIAFAVLANETICGQPSNVPGATGARGRRILGVIVPGRPSDSPVCR